MASEKREWRYESSAAVFNLDALYFAQRVQRISEKLEFRGLVQVAQPTVSFTIHVTGVMVDLHIKVPDVSDPDKTTTIVTGQLFDLYRPYDDQYIAFLLREMVRGLWEHELNEGVLFAGKPVVDPHPPWSPK